MASKKDDASGSRKRSLLHGQDCARANPIPAESGFALDSRVGACPCRRTGGHFAATCAGAALAIGIVTGSPVHADVRVSGDITAVRVEATKSNVGEVVSALESSFRVRVNTSLLLDSPVGGTFTGSLPQVVSRLLEGYNYFIRRQAGEVEVTIVGIQGDRAIAAERPRPAAGYGLAQSRASTGNLTPRNR